jgi:hypothetical protein
MLNKKRGLERPPDATRHSHGRNAPEAECGRTVYFVLLCVSFEEGTCRKRKPFPGKRWGTYGSEGVPPANHEAEEKKRTLAFPVKAARPHLRPFSQREKGVSVIFLREKAGRMASKRRETADVPSFTPKGDGALYEDGAEPESGMAPMAA